jgi:hypothetical protein
VNEFDRQGLVSRTKPLPESNLRGRFLVTEEVVQSTGRALRSFHGRTRRHEGIVYWAGIETPGETIFLHALIPVADHTWGSVFVDKSEVGRMQRVSRALGLGLLCQVHSHPGLDARHSDGDDDLVLLPFEGMLSIVAPHYGDQFGLDTAFIHQFQDHQWTLCRSAADSIVVAKAVTDLRS